MVISSQVHPDFSSDFALFETSLEILRAMSDHGNLAATEFYDNLIEVQQCLGMDLVSHGRHTPLDDAVGMSDETPIRPPSVVPDHAARLSVGVSGHLPETTAPGNLMDEMAFLGESMEEFLAQPDVDFGLDSSGAPISADAVYSWSNDSLWTA